MCVRSGSSEPSIGCFTPRIAVAGERSSTIWAPAAAYSASEKTRFVHGWTRTRSPFAVARPTWAGVSGALRSHFE
eukprot:scaffold170200_cov30-Tisochrysis_lutea.AAC.2